MISKDGPSQMVTQSISESRTCWFVGASWEGHDQTQRFIDEGIWENGYDDKYRQDVKSIRVGDRIAIKSTYTRKNDLPFSNRGNHTASVMGIKAIGVVTVNNKNGKQIAVDWNQTFSPPKEWYFYTGRNTIWKVEPGGWMAEALIKFAFENTPQNYKKFANHSFWKERFGDIPKEDVRFKWAEFYEEIANALSSYRNGRAHLVEWVKATANRHGLSYIEGKDLDDVDPFTVMGMFNRGMTDENRKKVALDLASLLDIKVTVPDSFEAIPILNNQKSWFFADKGTRNDNDIDNLWSLFEEAKCFADETTESDSKFITLYNRVAAQKGIRWNLTMGLYWIRPWFYPTLESQTREYLSSLSIKPELNGPKKSCSGNDYLLLRDNLISRFAEEAFPVHSFPELSLHAWQKPTQKKVGKTTTWKNAVLSRIKDLCLSKSSPLFNRSEFKEHYLDELQALFPENNSTEFSIDSNMQKLRDEGEVEFISSGQYRWLGFDDGELDTVPEMKIRADDYGINDIINDGCFLPVPELERILSRLQNKKNIILQGPPGTGKTWLGKRLAYALIGQKQPAFIKAVQFHPNLSYEDFIKGWRPSGDGKLTLCEGPFLETIKLALQNPQDKYVVVIEEINRGNPAQIFGEMLTLLEADKRTPSEALALCYSQDGDEPIYVPENLYVIGTMNVADRSLALVDLALRRRFAFVNLTPTFGKPWRDWVNSKTEIDTRYLETIESRMMGLNAAIENDERLGAQFQVGHSYVTPAFSCEITDVESWFKDVVETEIYPLLEEYWFDAPEKALKQKEALLKPL